MDPISAVANALGSIAGILPAIGIGTKSRKAEITAAGNMQISVLNAGAVAAEEKAKTTTKILVVSGILIFVIVIIVLTLRKK